MSQIYNKVNYILVHDFCSHFYGMQGCFHSVRKHPTMMDIKVFQRRKLFSYSVEEEILISLSKFMLFLG